MCAPGFLILTEVRRGCSRFSRSQGKSRPALRQILGASGVRGRSKRDSRTLAPSRRLRYALAAPAFIRWNGRRAGSLRKPYKNCTYLRTFWFTETPIWV